MRERNWFLLFACLVGLPFYALGAFIELLMFLFIRTFRRIGKMHKVHYLKTLPVYFDAVLSGKKTFEFRRNDRDFQEGDILVLKEYDPLGGFTGREITRHVGYVLYGADCGLIRGFCIMTLEPCPGDIPANPFLQEKRDSTMEIRGRGNLNGAK
jgi:hypothetical protein